MSQMDAADGSFSEPKSQESTGDVSYFGQKLITRFESSVDPEPQESNRDKSSVDPEPKESNRDESTVDPEKHESIRDKSSVDPEPKESTRDKSSVDPEPRESTRDKSSVESVAQENITDISFGEPEIQGNTKDNSSVEPVAQESTKDISSDNPEPWEGARDKSSDDLEPRESTANTALADVKSQEYATGLGRPQSPVSSADKSSGEDKSADISIQSQESTVDMSFGAERSQENVKNKASGEPASETSTTVMAPGEEVLQERDKSSGEPQLEEEPHMATKEIPLCELEPQTVTAGNDLIVGASSFGEEKLQVHITEKASSASTTDKSQERNTDKSASKQGPQIRSIAEQEYQNEEPSEGTTIHSGAKPKTSIYSGKLETQMGTVDVKSFAEVKSHANVTEESWDAGTSDKSTVEPESQGSNIDKSASKEQLQVRSIAEQEYQNEELSQAMSTHSGAKPEPSTSSGKLESENDTIDSKPSGEEKSHIHITEGSWDARTSDMSMIQAQGSKIDKSAGKQEPQIRSIAEQEHQNEEPSEGTSIHPGAKPKTPTYSGKVESEMGAIDHQPSREEKPKIQLTESKENNEDNVSYQQEFQESELKHRKPTHSGAKPESLLYPDKSPSHRDTAGNFGDGQTQESSRKPYELQPQAAEAPGTTGFLLGAVIAVLVLLLCFMSQKQQPSDHKDSPVDIFFKEFASVKNDFPGQYEGLWFRSEKLLQKHINMSDPSAPSILILTAARDGEQTLRCVSKRIAKSYADSFSTSWLMVDGLSKSKSDSATSKLQIDNELSSGFQSNSRAAVLYRLETLPPGSLLILYKYCDHENAAFKNVALVLTVLLEEQSLETDLSLTEVEEKVKYLLWERFANSEVAAHNEMDVDKLSGVWSRISHVVLPVLPVASVESGSCPGIEN